MAEHIRDKIYAIQYRLSYCTPTCTWNHM